MGKGAADGLAESLCDDQIDGRTGRLGAPHLRVPVGSRQIHRPRNHEVIRKGDPSSIPIGYVMTCLKAARQEGKIALSDLPGTKVLRYTCT